MQPTSASGGWWEELLELDNLNGEDSPGGSVGKGSGKTGKGRRCFTVRGMMLEVRGAVSQCQDWRDSLGQGIQCTLLRKLQIASTCDLLTYIA
jgi:hypothetical protein